MYTHTHTDIWKHAAHSFLFTYIAFPFPPPPRPRPRSLSLHEIDAFECSVSQYNQSLVFRRSKTTISHNDMFMPVTNWPNLTFVTFSGSIQCAFIFDFCQTLCCFNFVNSLVWLLLLLLLLYYYCCLINTLLYQNVIGVKRFPFKCLSHRLDHSFAIERGRTDGRKGKMIVCAEFLRVWKKIPA